MSTKQGAGGLVAQGQSGPCSGVDRGQGAELRQQLRVRVQTGQAALLQRDGLC